MSQPKITSSEIHLWQFDSRKIDSENGLKRILASYIGKHASDITFVEGPHGKPYLKESPIPLYFNLSHTGNLVVVGLSLYELGIDIEQMSEERNITSLASRMMSKKQFQIFQAVSDPKIQTSFFYKYWTFFEALVKALGVTQFTKHKSISNLIIESPYSAVVSIDGWTIMRLDIQKGIAAALATPISDPKISLYIYQPL